ncbi:unnamed protein product, partial [marine sediment metagenome]
DPATAKQAAPDAYDWDAMIEELAKTQRGVLEAAVGGGYIYISNIEPQNVDNVVSPKTYQDVNDNILQSCTTDTKDIKITVIASSPLVKISDIDQTLTKQNGYFSGTVNYTLTAENIEEVTITLITPDGEEGPSDSCTVNIEVGPTLLNVSFYGAYPNGQTELKKGDTFQISGTTDIPCVGVKVLDYGACQLGTPTFPSTNTFVITVTIADRGVTVQNLSAQVQAKNAAGAYGTIRETNQEGGAVDGIDLIKVNNRGPTFQDIGT